MPGNRRTPPPSGALPTFALYSLIPWSLSAIVVAGLLVTALFLTTEAIGRGSSFIGLGAGMIKRLLRRSWPGGATPTTASAP